MDIDQLNEELDGHGIRVTGDREHSKASEKWVEVVIVGPDGSSHWWEGPIPYQDQRAQLELNTDQEIADYLKSIRAHFEPDEMKEWAENERRYWNEHFNTPVTGRFFEQLLSLGWMSSNDYPLNPNGRPNSNPQRRIQDIKDKGYTVVFQEGNDNEASKAILVPLPRRDAHIYESISPNLRRRILAVLTRENAYDLSSGGGLIPDHKFPEMRWDTETPRDNPDNMTNDQIRAKFQILDNRRNLQKREVCRRCYQTGERGKPLGIDFFYAGGPRWDDSIPKNGAEAERGCVGCGWYDIRAWREALTNLANKPSEP